MTLEILDIENIKAKIPTDYKCGIFGIMGGTATLKQVEVNLKTGETKDIKSTDIKMSAEATGTDAPLLMNEYTYNKGDDHCIARYHIIEVTGGLIHPVSIEGTCLKRPVATLRQNIEPPKNIAIQGIIRSATSTITGETQDKNMDIHTLTGYFVRKFTVYLIDGLDYSIKSLPSNDTMIEKLKDYRTSIPDYYNYRSQMGLTKYRL